MSHKAAEQSRNERRQCAEQAARASGRRRRLRIMIGTASALALVAAVTAMMAAKVLLQLVPAPSART